jgi:hypothetical protein
MDAKDHNFLVVRSIQYPNLSFLDFEVNLPQTSPSFTYKLYLVSVRIGAFDCHSFN